MVQFFWVITWLVWWMGQRWCLMLYLKKGISFFSCLLLLIALLLLILVGGSQYNYCGAGGRILVVVGMREDGVVRWDGHYLWWWCWYTVDFLVLIYLHFGVLIIFIQLGLFCEFNGNIFIL